MLRQWRRVLASSAMIAVLAGCPGDSDPGPQAISGEGMTPEQQMRAALEQVVQAQERHFEAHGSYADDTTILLDDFGFRPVGDTNVVLSYQGTAAEWGYLATAIHPFSDVSCSVQHGRPGPEQDPFVGRIAC